MVGVYDGSQLRVYINGVLRGSKDTSVVPADRPFPVTLGREVRGWFKYIGMMSGAAIYERALSATEIAAHYAAGQAADLCAGGCPEGMRGYWRLDDGGGTVAHDRVAGHDGALSGGGFTWTPQPALGTWDGATKTCTLTRDVPETIQFDQAGLTLDCAGHRLVGDGTGVGVQNIWWADSTVRNCRIEGFPVGIRLGGKAHRTRLQALHIDGATYGIFGTGEKYGGANKNSVLEQIVTTNTQTGVRLDSNLEDVTIRQSDFSGNGSGVGIYLATDCRYNAGHLRYIIESNRASNRQVALLYDGAACGQGDRIVGNDFSHSDYGLMCKSWSRTFAEKRVTAAYIGGNDLSYSRQWAMLLEGFGGLEFDANFNGNDLTGSNSGADVGGGARVSGANLTRFGLRTVGLRIWDDSVVEGVDARNIGTGDSLNVWDWDGQNYRNGGSIVLAPCDRCVVRNCDVSGTGQGIGIAKPLSCLYGESSYDLTITGNTINNRAFGIGFVGACGLGNTVIEGNTILNAQYGIAIHDPWSAAFEGALIKGNRLTGLGSAGIGGAGISLRGTYAVGRAVVTDNTITGYNHGLWLSNAQRSEVTHNNVYSNTVTQVLSHQAMEVSVGGEGHYWGRSCPPPLFIPGVDSNRLDVTDSYAYGVRDGWLHGYSPGCNGPPIADAGADQTVECAGPGGTLVTVDGSNSTDPDGDSLTYTWTGPFPEGGGTVNGVQPIVTLTMGSHTIQLVVSDGEFSSAPDSVVVTVPDTVPPAITLVGDAEVSIECPGPYADPGAVAEDVCEGSVAVATDGVVDACVPGDYTIRYLATDASGNEATALRRVHVVDTQAPTIIVRAAPIQLWPPNHDV